MNISQFILTKLFPKKILFIRLMQVAYVLGTTIFFTSVFHPQAPRYWTELGELAGKGAIFTLSITLLPGMIKRFQIKGVLTAVQVFIMSIRRALGLLVYYLVVLHMLWVKVLPAYRYDLDIFSYTTFELMGLAGFLLLTPMAFTSNDASVRKLGKNWKRIHSAVYVVVWLIFFHVLLMRGSLTMTGIAGLLGVLEIASWIYFLKTTKRSAPPQVEPVAETPQQPQQPQG